MTLFPPFSCRGGNINVFTWPRIAEQRGMGVLFLQEFSEKPDLAINQGFLKSWLPMASHGFPWLPRVSGRHLLLHEQMKILPEAAEEVKTDLTSVRVVQRLKTRRNTSESSEESANHWINMDKSTVADGL